MFAAVAHMQHGDRRGAYTLVLGSIAANAFWIATGVGLLTGVAQARALYELALTHHRLFAVCGGVIVGAFGFYFLWNREALVGARISRRVWTTFSVALHNPDRMFFAVLLARPFGIHLDDLFAATSALSGMVLGDAAGWFITLYLCARFAPAALFGRLIVFVGGAFVVLGVCIVAYGLWSY